MVHTAKLAYIPVNTYLQNKYFLLFYLLNNADRSFSFFFICLYTSQTFNICTSRTFNIYMYIQIPIIFPFKYMYKTIPIVQSFNLYV